MTSIKFPFLSGITFLLSFILRLFRIFKDKPVLSSLLLLFKDMVNVFSFEFSVILKLVNSLFRFCISSDYSKLLNSLLIGEFLYLMSSV